MSGEDQSDKDAHARASAGEDAAQRDDGGSAMRMKSGSFGLGMRSYFSSHMLWSAYERAESAREIEDQHEAQSRRGHFYPEHRAHVAASLLCAAAFLEGWINEIVEDVVVGHQVADRYPGLQDPGLRGIIADWWREHGREGSPLTKTEKLLGFAGVEPLDKTVDPYESADRLRHLRNALAHPRPETVWAATTTEMEPLRGRFLGAKTLAGSGNAWWPDHCLGYGCCAWAISSATNFSQHVEALVGIRDVNYRTVTMPPWLLPFGSS